MKHTPISPVKQAQLEALFEVRYLSPDQKAIVQSDPDDMYTFTVYHGRHTVPVEQGDCVFIKSPSFSTSTNIAWLIRGPVSVESHHFAVIVRGYAPASKSVELTGRMVLPYVNGCSTRQLFPPERPGDPTLQLLNIPPYSSEQAHHIHSTARIVYVLEGEGWSVVGTETENIRQKLVPGMTIILNNMCPHHFETEGSKLLVMPVHVFSALPSGLEMNHPMFNGTFMLNQGR